MGGCMSVTNYTSTLDQCSDSFHPVYRAGCFGLPLYPYVVGFRLKNPQSNHQQKRTASSTPSMNPNCWRTTCLVQTSKGETKGGVRQPCTVRNSCRRLNCLVNSRTSSSFSLPVSSLPSLQILKTLFATLSHSDPLPFPWGGVLEQSAKVFKQTFQLFLNSPSVRTPYNLLPAPPKRTRADLRPVNEAKHKPKKNGKTLDLTAAPLKPMPSETTKELVLAFAAGQLPTEYAILRNLMREVQSRMNWHPSSSPSPIQILDFAAKHGSGAWAAIATFPSTLQRKNTYIQLEPSRMQADLSRHLLQPNTPGPVSSWANLYYRSYVNYLQSRPGGVKKHRSIALCGFQLSTMRRSADRRRVLRQMWNSGAEVMIVAEHATKDCFEVVQEAREFLLELGRKEVEDEAKRAEGAMDDEGVEKAKKVEKLKRDQIGPDEIEPEKFRVGGVEVKDDGNFGFKSNRSFKDAKDALEADVKAQKAVERFQQSSGALVKEDKILGSYVLAPVSLFIFLSFLRLKVNKEH